MVTYCFVNTSVSIITPSYNQAFFIERTIQSVLNQEVSNLEYFVIDSNSTDSTPDILSKYDSKLQWISEKDAGQANAINKGFEKTSGEIVGWLNSDDIYYSGVLKDVVAYFNAHPDVDVIYGDAAHIDVYDNKIKPYNTQGWNLHALKRRCYISQPALFLRRKAILRCGYLDESLRFCMDYEYWLRLGFCGMKFAYVPQLFAGSRVHKESKSMKYRVAAQKESIRMLKRYFTKTSTRWYFSYVYAALRTMFLD